MTHLAGKLMAAFVHKTHHERRIKIVELAVLGAEDDSG